MRLTAKIKRPDKEDLIVYTKGTYEDTIPAEMTKNDIRAILKNLPPMRMPRNRDCFCGCRARWEIRYIR